MEPKATPNKKIELPVAVLDNSQNSKTKPVLYDVEKLRHTNIRDWDEGGVPSKGKCVIFSDLKIGNKDDFTVIAMSKEALIEKLSGAGLIEVIK